MSIRKKRHLIAGTIIGGMLLAATTQTGNSFALSDTSSPSTGSSTTTSQQAPTNTTTDPTSTTTPSTSSSIPATQGTNAVATGSSASQSANNSTGVTSSAATDPSSSTTPPTSTTPQQTSATTPSTGDPNSSVTNDTTAKNDVKSTANTGDAAVEHTTVGGDATSGNASAVADVVNTVGTSSTLNSGDIQTFNYNVNGDQNGNIVINPNDILTSSTTATDPAIVCAPTGTATAQNNTTINNLINLMAQTGNAKVNDNGVGGNATSGNATTEANVVNMIQDLVSNKGAFLGVININGSLNGNIELPASVVNSLLTSTQTGNTAAGNTTATNNMNVNNNITLTALTGTAAVTNNGQGGNAISGNAQTLLNECNLINSNIVGGNLLLVFVNVMGHWYGALLSEPTGDTTAQIGGGITQDTFLPTGQTSATNNETINNNIHLTSISGNATVANNGVGGNATTGNASAIADVTNILGSQIDLSGWLGILIINVYGTWNGSVVIQPTTTADPNVGGNSTSGAQNTVVTSNTHTIPNQNSPDGDDYGYYIVNPPQSFDGGQFDLASAHVLGASTVLPGNNVSSGIHQVAATTTIHGTQTAKHLAADFILAGIGLALALTGGITRFFATRRGSN